MHFTDPFHVTTRVADNCSDGTLLLQVYIPQLPCATSQCIFFKLSYTCFLFHFLLQQTIVPEDYYFHLFSQVILQSQVKASLAISDAWLDLQDGFAHAGKGDGKPVSKFFPLIVSSKSRAGILFSICVVDAPAKGRPIFFLF